MDSDMTLSELEIALSNNENVVDVVFDGKRDYLNDELTDYLTEMNDNAERFARRGIDTLRDKDDSLPNNFLVWTALNDAVIKYCVERTRDYPIRSGITAEVPDNPVELRSQFKRLYLQSVVDEARSAIAAERNVITSLNDFEATYTAARKEILGDVAGIIKEKAQFSYTK